MLPAQRKLRAAELPARIVMTDTCQLHMAARGVSPENDVQRELQRFARALREPCGLQRVRDSFTVVESGVVGRACCQKRAHTTFNAPSSVLTSTVRGMLRTRPQRCRRSAGVQACHPLRISCAMSLSHFVQTVAF